ncbi:MAG: hypothetical protein WBA63_06280 [Thermomicrobiales bacterium]
MTSERERDLPAGLTAPARLALDSIGITGLDHLTEHRASDVLELHGIGPKGIRTLREALAEAGLSFAGEAGGPSARD